MLTQDDMHITEVVLSVKEVLKRPGSTGGVHHGIFDSYDALVYSRGGAKEALGKPVSLMVPVNLRNYFPSKSMTNFFGWIEVGYEFKENTRFEEVLLHIKKFVPAGAGERTD